MLQPIYDKLGPDMCYALPGFHSITGADISGRIHGVGKKTAFKVLQFMCMVISSKTVASMSPATLRWKKIRNLLRVKMSTYYHQLLNMAPAYLQSTSPSIHLGA